MTHLIATHVTTSQQTELTLERVITAGSVIKLTDAGAGSTITVAVDIDGNTTHYLRGDGTWATVTSITHLEIFQDSDGAIVVDSGGVNIMYLEVTN